MCTPCTTEDGRTRVSIASFTEEAGVTMYQVSVTTHPADGMLSWEVQRRFSAFLALHDDVKDPLALPPFPLKKHLFHPRPVKLRRASRLTDLLQSALDSCSGSGWQGQIPPALNTFLALSAHDATFTGIAGECVGEEEDEAECEECRVNIHAATFGECMCGSPKAEHSAAALTLNSPRRSPRKSTEDEEALLVKMQSATAKEVAQVYEL